MNKTTENTNENVEENIGNDSNTEIMDITDDEMNRIMKEYKNIDEEVYKMMDMESGILEFQTKLPGVCKSCGDIIYIYSFLDKSMIPIKQFSTNICKKCNIKLVSESDFLSLPYGVEIVADIDTKDFQRGVFLNNNSNVILEMDGVDVIEINIERSLIDTLEGLYYYLEEIISVSGGKEVVKYSERINNGETFRIKIKDPSGYSRICSREQLYSEYLVETYKKCFYKGSANVGAKDIVKELENETEKQIYLSRHMITSDDSISYTVTGYDELIRENK